MKTNRHIVVLQAGFVFIGEWHPATDTKPAHILDVACVRKWGTTAGLGEIALNGPTEETVLDPCGTVILDNPAALLFTIPCQ